MMSNSSLQNAVTVTLISLIYLILVGCIIDINNFGTGISPTFAKEVGTHQSSNKASSNQPSISTSHSAKNNNSNQTIGNTINPPTPAVPITPPPSPVHPINNNTNPKNGTTLPQPPSPVHP